MEHKIGDLFLSADSQNLGVITGYRFFEGQLYSYEIDWIWGEPIGPIGATIHYILMPGLVELFNKRFENET
jgi:hypothetical protein